MCCSSRRTRCRASGSNFNPTNYAHGCGGGYAPHCGHGRSNCNAPHCAQGRNGGYASTPGLTEVARMMSQLNTSDMPPAYPASHALEKTNFVDEKHLELLAPPAYDGTFREMTSSHTNMPHPSHSPTPLVAKYVGNPTIKADLLSLDAALRVYGERRCGGWGMVRRAKKQLRNDLADLEEKEVEARGGRWRCREWKGVKREVNGWAGGLMDEARGY